MDSLPPLVLYGAVFAAHVVLPGLLLYGVGRAREPTRVQWTLRVCSAAAYIGLIFIAGRWDQIGVAARYVPPILLMVAAAVGVRRMRQRPWLASGVRWRVLGDSAGLCVLLVFLALSLRGFVYRGEPVELELPLQAGRYYVVHGGDSVLLNHHNRLRAQRYALDILGLNALGMHASRVHATKLDDYVAFGASVFSPCDGSVIEIVDGLSDQTLGRRDTSNPAGNFVAIRCHGVRVLLAHLQRGSVAARAGQRVATGDPIGRVGNSGNSSEPHLHLQATRSDANHGEQGVPILLAGRFAVRNTLFVD